MRLFGRTEIFNAILCDDMILVKTNCEDFRRKMYCFMMKIVMCFVTLMLKIRLMDYLKPKP